MSAMIRRFVVAFAFAVPLAAVAPSLAAARAKPAAPPRPPARPNAAFAPEAPEPPEPPLPPVVVLASASESASGRGRLGVQVSSMTPELRKFLGAKQEAGILVQRVEPGSAAARAGMKVGDIVVAVDGDAIGEIGEVKDALADRGKGDEVAVVVVRKKARRTVRVELQQDAGDHGFLGGDVHIHGVPGGSGFGEGPRDELEKLRATIDSLETRLNALEKRDRARRRASKPKR